MQDASKFGGGNPFQEFPPSNAPPVAGLPLSSAVPRSRAEPDDFGGNQEKRWRARRSVALGISAGVILLGFYLLVVGLMNRSFVVGLRDLSRWWYWFLPLSVGLGVQVGMLAYLRLCHSSHGSVKGVAASTGTSSGAMLACCLHHVADFAPLLGLSAASTFLARFQQPLFALALLTNILAVGLLYRRLRQASLHTERTV